MKGFLSVAALTIAVLVPPADARGTAVVVMGIVPTSGGDVVQQGQRVEFGDLDVASAQGAATLLSRIEKAAAVVCAGNARGRSLMSEKKTERCRSKAIKDAVSAIDSAPLTELANK